MTEYKRIYMSVNR